LVIIICSAVSLSGQQKKVILEGNVSFISSQHIYVKFSSTENIQIGDTLFIQKEKNLLPVLFVSQHSSSSCICKMIGQPNLKVSDAIFALVKENKKITSKAISAHKDTTEMRTENQTSIARFKKPAIPNKDQVVQGRLSVSSYSNLSNVPASNDTRFRYTLLFNIANPNSSKLSFESYVTFTHKSGDWAAVNKDIFNALKIYSLAIKYNLNDKIDFWVGRKINPKVSSLGAIDGLQTEYNSGKFFFGLVGGSRPDYMNYSFNFKLFEYGAYIGQHYTSDTGTEQTTAAFFEQNNNGKTDRRFIYFQHDNSLAKNLNLFISSEIDLFKIQNGLPVNSLSLTSLYVSLGYRISRQLSVFGSYDERRNVIYYETFRSRGDSIFDAATRQGIQFRINFHPGKLINMGLGAGHQFRNNDLRATDNINGYINFNQVPWKNGSTTLSSNLLRTSYLNGKIYGLKIDRDLISGKLTVGLGYQYVDFQYLSSNTSMFQHLANLDLFWRINRKLSFSVNCEKTFEKPVSYTRIYANLIKRF
jgi:hypothetical protein